MSSVYNEPRLHPAVFGVKMIKYLMNSLQKHPRTEHYSHNLVLEREEYKLCITFVTLHVSRSLWLLLVYNSLLSVA